MDIDGLIERVQSTHAKYLQEKERFKKGIEDAQDKVVAAQKLSEDTAAELDAVKQQLKSAQDEIEIKSAEIDKMTSKEKVDEIMSNDAALYRELKNKYEDLKESCDVLKDEKDSLEKTIESLNKNAENFNKYTEGLKGELKDANTANAGLQNKIDAIEEQKADLEVAFAELKEKHNKCVETEAGLNNISKENDSLKKAILDKDSLISILQNKNEELKQQIEKLSRDLSNLHTESLEKSNKTTSSLQSFIDSTLPVPQESAAATLNVRPVKKSSEISEGTVPYKFGRTSPAIMDKVVQLVLGLFKDSVKNNLDQYPLQDPMSVAVTVGMDENTCDVTIKRLQAMTFIDRPLIVYKENKYFANIDSETLINYIKSN